eukprot:15338640-Ditylum_brightwellii.AAC.1
MVQYIPGKFKAKFLNPMLQRIEGEPDYVAINAIMLQLYENAATIQSSLGGGAHGHIGIVMEPTMYFNLSATAYAPPTAPARVMLPGNASSQARYDKDNWHRKDLDTFENHIAMDDVLKKQIQEAVDDVYICQLRHKYSTFLGVMAGDVPDHLMDRYGQIKTADLVANGDKYNQPMDISQPIDAYFACIDDCIQHESDGKTPNTSKQILTTALHTMQRT